MLERGRGSLRAPPMSVSPHFLLLLRGRRARFGSEFPVLSLTSIVASATGNAKGLRGAEAQFRGPAFMGARIFRLDLRSGRTGDPGIYPQPGTRRCASGTVEPLAMTRRGRL